MVSAMHFFCLMEFIFMRCKDQHKEKWLIFGHVISA